MSPSRPTRMRSIYVDMRCLQDPAYRDRGIGVHVASVLGGRAASEFRDARVVGLLDPASPDLAEHLRGLCDETTFCLNPITDPDRGDIYIQSSPMTHDVADTWSFRWERGILSAAIVYDFIPLDWPGYLATKASRIGYLARLARLRSYEYFFPISSYTAGRLRELTGVSERRIIVTGAPIRASLAAAAARRLQAGGGTATPYALVVGGEDQRKNLGTAIEAVRLLRRQGIAIQLQAVGSYTEAFRRGALESCPGEWLSFSPYLTDDQLVELYSGAAACIVPSHIEGFSLPVVEAAECGCPVLASNCAAHLELLDDEEALFRADTPGQLAERLGSLLRDDKLRARLRRGQSALSGQFVEQRVGERFWGGIAEACRESEKRPLLFAAARKRLPRVALLSPYPPDQSGVALYSERMLAASSGKLDVSLYTDAPGPLNLPGQVRHAGPLTSAPIVKGAYDAVLLVIGNSDFHNPMLDIAERYGGPAILHDSRLTQIYHHRLGRAGFTTLATRLLQRPVYDEEIEGWLRDQDPPTLFFETILRRCSPVMVHSRPFQELLRTRYGAQTRVLPFPPIHSFSEAEVEAGHRRRVRAKLGLSPDSFVISSFGHVEPSKSPAACIVAVELLRAWNIPAEFYFVGRAGHYEPELRRVARAYGVTDHIHFFEHFVSKEAYRDYLIASDAGVQLRNHGFGQVSGALADCASAGLPTIAPATLVEACGVPSYCRGLAELASSLQIAEALAEIEAGRHLHSRGSEERRRYLRASTFECYVDAIIEALGYG